MRRGKVIAGGGDPVAPPSGAPRCRPPKPRDELSPAHPPQALLPTAHRSLGWIGTDRTPAVAEDSCDWAAPIWWRMEADRTRRRRPQFGADDPQRSFGFRSGSPDSKEIAFKCPRAAARCL